MTIDQVMIEERAKVQEETRVFVQRLMDDYESGIALTEVKLQAADPPEAVKDAFHDVVRAREDREKLINQARGYQADILPRARGSAEQILREAEGYKKERVLRAQGEAARFLSVLAEYEKAKDVTRDRLHLETVEQILAETDKERTIILATAEQQAQKLRGEGDAEATRIYAQAYGQDPEFYRFVRSLESYEAFLPKRSTLLLSADSQLFRYLAGPHPEDRGLASATPSLSTATTATAGE
jgi:regulator of protease activity HflC (stomatin/prohibitin superfamily)